MLGMRLPPLRGLLLGAFILAGVVRLAAQSALFIVRHAEHGPEEPDAHLTPLGLQQADELATLLADAGIKRIFTTELTRTRQTAAPIARQADVVPVVVPQQDFDGLVARIRSTLRDGETTLAVGHRSTVPRLVKALGGGEITPLAFDEFTRLIVLVPGADGATRVVTLRYGRKRGP